MQIQVLNGLFNKSVLKNNYPTNNFNTSQFNLKMQPPIARDTVSFQGKGKKVVQAVVENTAKNVTEEAKISNKSWEANLQTARQIIKKLEKPFVKVESFMDDTFGDLVATKKNPNNPIMAISSRIKSDFSLAEKVGTIKAMNTNEIMEQMTDPMGSKIVLRSSLHDDVDRVLDRLIPQIKNRTIEILEIENKRSKLTKGLPEYEIQKYDYGSMAMLKKIANIQDQTYKKGGSTQKIARHFDDQYINYNGIHMTIKINGKMPAVFELQIFGNNVNKGKKVDDWLYKKLAGKNPAITSPKLEKTFAPFLDKHFFDAEPNAKEIVAQAKENYGQYRAEVMLFQRKKPDVLYGNDSQEFFLPLSENIFPPEIAEKYGIKNSDFDFNNVAKDWLEAEKAYNKAKKLEKEAKEAKRKAVIESSKAATQVSNPTTESTMQSGYQKKRIRNKVK